MIRRQGFRRLVGLWTVAICAGAAASGCMVSPPPGNDNTGGGNANDSPAANDNASAPSNDNAANDNTTAAGNDNTNANQSTTPNANTTDNDNAAANDNTGGADCGTRNHQSIPPAGWVELSTTVDIRVEGDSAGFAALLEATFVCPLQMNNQATIFYEIFESGLVSRSFSRVTTAMGTQLVQGDGGDRFVVEEGCLAFEADGTTGGNCQAYEPGEACDFEGYPLAVRTSATQIEYVCLEVEACGDEPCGDCIMDGPDRWTIGSATRLTYRALGDHPDLTILNCLDEPVALSIAAGDTATLVISLDGAYTVSEDPR